jgi:hypothetical protein
MSPILPSQQLLQHGLGHLHSAQSVVINMEHAAFDQGLAQQLANHLKAPCYALSELKAENLYHAVKACPEQRRRDEMAKPMKK